MADREGVQPRCLVLYDGPNATEIPIRDLDIADILARLSLDEEYLDFCLTILRRLEERGDEVFPLEGSEDPKDAKEGD
jgi:hypothetical protein